MMPVLPMASHVSEHWSSPDGLRFARAWLDECLQKHEHGDSLRTAEALLPTRVIDVGDGVQADPHLHEPPPGTRGVYAALSYTWGTGRSFTNTTSRYSRLKQGFKIGDLPNTIRDAVLVARRLSIPYLWIDQLCIIQDSPSDWQRESSNMCSVYQNACVTFATLESASGDSGLWD